VKDQSDLEQMTAALRTARAFAFSLHIHSDHQQQQVIQRFPAGKAAATAATAAELQGPWPWEVYGVAFSTSGAAAWYIPLYKCGSRRRLRLLWEGVRALLEDRQLKKIGFAVKQQLKLLAAPPPLGALIKEREPAAAGSGGGGGGGDSGAAGDESGGALISGPGASAAAAAADAGDSGSVGLQPIVVADPIVDVRICAWMLQPGDYGWERRIQPGSRGMQSQAARLRELVTGKLGIEDGEKVRGWMVEGLRLVGVGGWVVTVITKACTQTTRQPTPPSMHWLISPLRASSAHNCKHIRWCMTWCQT